MSEGVRGMCKRFTVIALVGAVLSVVPLPASAEVDHGLERVVPNDNTHPAGAVDGSTLTVRLRTATGRWQPEGSSGPSLVIEAFGEEGGALSVPAPLVRVREGTTVIVSIRNDLASPLRVHGLCARDGAACSTLDVPAGAIREARFLSGRAGTYHYWATTIGAPFPFRELAGALVVDPPGGEVAPDRIFVITEWTNLEPEQLAQIVTADDASEAFLALQPKLTFVINGLSWPATERLAYRRGALVRWRIINLSSQSHPMHLHGFYFTVTHVGDGRGDGPVNGGAGQREVTHVLPSGGTMSLEWLPEREGRWLFHCHILHHVSPARRLSAGSHHGGREAPAEHHTNGPHDGALGMAGMVLGITVTAPEGDHPASAPPSTAKARRFTLAIGRATSNQADWGFSIRDEGRPTADTPAMSPGPPLVLRRGESVEILVVNRLDEPTSIHWHGLEVDSIYDGVHGWSGAGPQVAPMIEPGGSFTVRITPARAGTFIYHTHSHDYRQLTSGLYGPLIVTEPDDVYDPETDHVIVVGRRDATEAAGILSDPTSVVLNGVRDPRWVWAAGKRHRVRLINITPDDIFAVSLRAADRPVKWRPLTKDGAPVSSMAEVPANQRIAVGETYDFEYEAPSGRRTLWLDVRSTSGRWQTQGSVIVR